MDAKQFVHKMPAAFDSEAAADISATVQYDLSEPVYMVIENGRCSVHDGLAPSADVTLHMDDDDFIALMRGELNGTVAFMSGQLRLDGDLTLASRIASFFDGSKF